MATTGKIFYNAVRAMSREELMEYVSKYAEMLELQVLLNSMDYLRKSCILDDAMNTALGEIETQLKEICAKESQPINLKILEGRILMLLLTQSMARHLKDKKRVFSTSQQITALFAEYVLEGGKKSFRSPKYLN